MTFSIAKPFKYLFYPAGWLTSGLSIMDRYITRELIMPFLFGMGAFSAIAVSIGALFDLVRRVTSDGLPLSTAAYVFLLRLPEFVVYAFPMATLLAAIMTYGRLSNNSELIALRGCGISVARLVLPAILLSCLVTGITFTFNELVVPQANYLADMTLEQALEEDEPPEIERDIVYREFGDVAQPNGQTDKVLSQLFYAREFDGQQMKGLTVLSFSPAGLSQVLVSEAAQWNPSTNRWNFLNGTTYQVAPDGSYSGIETFQSRELPISRTPLDLATRDRGVAEMNIAASEEYLDLLQQTGNEQEIRKLKVRIQKKYAFPFVCVVFGLIGAVLGTKPRRAARATGFGLSVLIIFVYYLLSFITEAFGQGGGLSPFMAAWLPNLFGFTIGCVLLARAT